MLPIKSQAQLSIPHISLLLIWTDVLELPLRHRRPRRGVEHWNERGLLWWFEGG